MMRRFVLMTLPLMLFPAIAVAQDRGVELHAGAGYVFDSGEGPSVPAATVGATGWITRRWGIGVRLSEGVRDEVDAGVALGDLRVWALTSQWRWFPGGTEINAGVGAGSSGFRYKHIQTETDLTFISGVGTNILLRFSSIRLHRDRRGFDQYRGAFSVPRPCLRFNKASATLLNSFIAPVLL